jgi:hypothetical protein
MLPPRRSVDSPAAPSSQNFEFCLSRPFAGKFLSPELNRSIEVESVAVKNRELLTVKIPNAILIRRELAWRPIIER